MSKTSAFFKSLNEKITQTLSLKALTGQNGLSGATGPGYANSYLMSKFWVSDIGVGLGAWLKT